MIRLSDVCSIGIVPGTIESDEPSTIHSPSWHRAWSGYTFATCQVCQKKWVNTHSLRNEQVELLL